MLFFTLWPDRRAASPYRCARRVPRVSGGRRRTAPDLGRRKIADRARYLSAGRRLGAKSPLRVHARYSREEMLAGIGWAFCGEKPRVPKGHATGTREVAHPGRRRLRHHVAQDGEGVLTDHDVPGLRDLAAGDPLGVAERPRVRRVHDPPIRRARGDVAGMCCCSRARARLGPLGVQPLMFLGPATYVSHEGSRPVAFRWRLDRPMPTDFFETARVVAS